ncbi:glycosyltransferase family 4 protein [Sulfitobacter sp. LCG007]
MARALRLALEKTGRQVEIASELRTRDADGDPDRQDALFAAARAEIPALAERGRAAGWACWVTYHCYFKAPDLLGPSVSAALDIPYVLIEATRARKRLTGPWARFADASERACDAADLIFYFTERDGETLLARAPAGQRVRPLAPFLPVAHAPEPSRRDGPMLSVGMFRTGDKLASYRLIAETLGLMQSVHWRLDIAGDGPAAPEIRALMRPFGDRVRFLGELGPDALSEAYARAALLFWPGVNEAFGLSYLEAQAAGLPVVAQDRPGVRDVLAPGDHPSPEDGARALANRLDKLMASPGLRRSRGEAARAHVIRHHLIDTAADRLDAGLREVGA